MFIEMLSRALVVLGLGAWLGVVENSGRTRKYCRGGELWNLDLAVDDGGRGSSDRWHEGLWGERKNNHVYCLGLFS